MAKLLNKEKKVSQISKSDKLDKSTVIYETYVGRKPKRKQIPVAGETLLDGSYYEEVPSKG